MQTKVHTQQPFPWNRFLKYVAFFALCFGVFVVPYLFVDKHTGIFLMLGYVVVMLIFEHLTTPKVPEPSNTLPPVVRQKVAYADSKARWDSILGMVFAPAVAFIFLAPQAQEEYATHGWTSALAITVFIVFNVWALAQKARA